jgi:hypothetical protein
MSSLYNYIVSWWYTETCPLLETIVNSDGDNDKRNAICIIDTNDTKSSVLDKIRNIELKTMNASSKDSVTVITVESLLTANISPKKYNIPSKDVPAIPILDLQMIAKVYLDDVCNINIIPSCDVRKMVVQLPDNPVLREIMERYAEDNGIPQREEF